MKIKVIYAKNARKNLNELIKTEASKIVLKIDFFTKQDNPMRYAKKLKPPFADLYRFRIGNHRAIFQIDDKGNIAILTVLAVKHRKDVYRD